MRLSRRIWESDNKRTMKRYIPVFLLLSMAAAAVVAQPYRSFSVWSGNGSTDFSLVTTDSFAVVNDSGPMVIYKYTGATDSIDVATIDSITVSVPDVVSTNKRTVTQLKAEFDTVSINKNSYKAVGNHNPLMGHKFGADPFGMVDGDRLYVYMTDDHIYKANGQPVGDGDYSDCRNVTIISSDDLVNWTDHGSQPVSGSSGPASWANNMWAPCAAHKTIDGKEKYFLYFADNASGIGVLTASHPYGPWKQPSGMNQLISHSTPNCDGKSVPWLFDPAVLVDDDGTAYLYFGGGIDGLSAADPGSARCVQLGSDMISIVGTPQQIKPPYLFEDAGINKVGGKYLYSYCANFNAGGNGPGSGNIGYMKSDNPLGPFTYVGKCFDNPGGPSWAGGGGNNHHAIVEFKGKYYILYHNRSLKKTMRADNKDITDGMEVRSTCINEIQVNTQNATITPLSSTDEMQKGVTQLKNFDPYQEVPGTTMAWERGITTQYTKRATKYVCTAEAGKGSWIGLSNVDFGSGAIAFTAKVKGKGIIKVCKSKPDAKGLSNTIAYAEITNAPGYSTITVPVVNIPTKVISNLYIVFSDEASLESWSFIRK